MPRPVSFTLQGRKDHGYCCWCKRPLVASNLSSDRAFTFDHVTPVRDGGRQKVPCCFKCNQLKGDLPAQLWCFFIDHNPGYWRQFDKREHVKDWIIAAHIQRVRDGLPPLISPLSPIRSGLGSRTIRHG